VTTDPPPHVSVILIVLDGADFLEEALASVAAQSMQEWELVIVDDGSTDATPSIARRFADEHPDRVRIVGHEGGGNRGMSASRNLGIGCSRAPYVTFLDHDDQMLPGKLETQARILDAHPKAGAVVGPNLRWNAWRGSSREDTVQDLRVPTDALMPPPGPLPVFLRHTASTPQAIMIRRAVIDAIGGFDPGFRGMYEDQVFLARLLLAHPVYITSAVLHRYRQHPDSCVSRAHRDGSQIIARRRFLQWLEAYVAATPEHAAAIRPVLDAELARTRFARWRAWVKRLR
jgi:glycosyltransferase involved in cell wall biosynthesis